MKICDIGRVVTGATPKRSEEDAWGHDVPFVTPSDIDDAAIHPGPSRRLTAAAAERLRRRLLPAGAVCFTCIASIGKMCMTRAPSVTNQQINAIVVDREAFNPRFVFYALRNNRERIAALASGSATPIISKGVFEQQTVLMPSLPEQTAIAEALGALDDKIEANRRIVTIMEGLARCLFADLVATLGDEGATFARLDTLVEHLPGKYLPRDQYTKAGPYKVYGSNSVMGSHHAYLYDGSFTVMARIGSNCGALMWSGQPAWVNNNASALRAKPGVDPWFLHRLLETIDMDQHRSGSGQPFIRVESLLSTVVMVPNARQQSCAGAKLRALAELAHSADRESMGLSALRDALLPKLLSGELRVRDAEQLVGETA